MSKDYTENPWDRQPGESKQAFEAFNCYLMMGTERSLRNVAEKLGKSRALMDRWSSRYKWVSRSDEYDNYLYKQELKANRKAVKDMRTRHTKTAAMMQSKALEALSKLNTEEISAKDIVSMLSKAIELERMSRIESIEDNPARSEETGHVSLADSIASAYRKRMEERNDDQ